MVEYADTPAGKIAYEVRGSGDPLVLLPGFLSSSAGWKMAGYLDHLGEYQVVLVDPLGHGRSAKSHDPADYSISNTVDQMRAVLDAADIDRAAMVGFSRGGLIAAMMVAHAPERVSAAVFGAVPLGDAIAPVVEEQRVGLEALRAGDWQAYWDSFPLPLPAAMQEAFSQSNDPLALAAALEAMLSWGDDGPELGVAATEIPCLAYFGSGEVFADRLRETLNTTSLRYIERNWGGHAETMMDASGVSGIITEFLEGVS